MELFFRKSGTGSPLIILHGLYGSSDNWISIAKQLAKQHTVYIIDQRNHGRSPFAGTHTYNDMKDDLLEFFEQQNIEKATLLGHSMGGKVAMWFAANHPEKTEKLIVADIAPKNYLHSQNNSFQLHRNILKTMLETDFSKVKTRNDADNILALKIYDKRIRQFLLKNIVKDKTSGIFKWRINIDVLYNYLEEIVSGVNKNTLEPKAPLTDYQVTFVRGLQSDYITDDDIPVIKKLYPGAKIYDIENAGHWMHAEQPEKFIYFGLIDKIEARTYRNTQNIIHLHSF